MIWPQKAVETAVALWTEGQPASAVSREIHARHGVSVTRSAVIIRMWREGLLHGGAEVRQVADRRPGPARREVRQARLGLPESATPPNKPAPAREAAPPRTRDESRVRSRVGGVVPPPGGVALARLGQGQCRWIEGAPTATAICCGALTIQENPGAGRMPVSFSHHAIPAVVNHSLTRTRMLAGRSIDT